MVIGAVLVTLTGVVVVANFMGGEKKIQQRVERHYPLDDPRFLNELGVLLGPPFIEGNRHQVLQNGEEIFPAMPAAIRSAKTSITFETYIYWSGDRSRIRHVPGSSPTGVSESMHLMYLFAITAASRSIDLSVAYFVPDDLMLRALLAAVKRGVTLRIVVPGEHIDSETVRSASRAKWGPLLEAGAVIAEYKPTMFHCKVMIVDGLMVSVGSTNFDNRSFRLNDEATLNIADAEFAKQQTAIFEVDLSRSRRITFAEWRARPLKEKIGERLASLLGSQL